MRPGDLPSPNSFLRDRLAAARDPSTRYDMRVRDGISKGSSTTMTPPLTPPHQFFSSRCREGRDDENADSSKRESPMTDATGHDAAPYKACGLESAARGGGPLGPQCGLESAARGGGPLGPQDRLPRALGAENQRTIPIEDNSTSYRSGSCAPTASPVTDLTAAELLAAVPEDVDITVDITDKDCEPIRRLDDSSANQEVFTIDHRASPPAMERRRRPHACDRSAEEVEANDIDDTAAFESATSTHSNVGSSQEVVGGSAPEDTSVPPTCVVVGRSDAGERTHSLENHLPPPSHVQVVSDVLRTGAALVRQQSPQSPQRERSWEPPQRMQRPIGAVLSSRMHRSSSAAEIPTKPHPAAPQLTARGLAASNVPPFGLSGTSTPVMRSCSLTQIPRCQEKASSSCGQIPSSASSSSATSLLLAHSSSGWSTPVMLTARHSQGGSAIMSARMSQSPRCVNGPIQQGSAPRPRASIGRPSSPINTARASVTPSTGSNVSPSAVACRLAPSNGTEQHNALSSRRSASNGGCVRRVNSAANLATKSRVVTQPRGAGGRMHAECSPDVRSPIPSSSARNSQPRHSVTRAAVVEPVMVAQSLAASPCVNARSPCVNARSPCVNARSPCVNARSCSPIAVTRRPMSSTVQGSPVVSSDPRLGPVTAIAACGMPSPRAAIRQSSASPPPPISRRRHIF